MTLASHHEYFKTNQKKEVQNGKKDAPGPSRLGIQGQNLSSDLHKDWTFSPAELEVLRLAVEAVDRAAKAQEVLQEHGLTAEDRFGTPRERPEVSIRTAAEASAAKLLRQLGLKEEAEKALKAAHIRSGTLRRYSEEAG